MTTDWLSVIDDVRARVPLATKIKEWVDLEPRETARGTVYYAPCPFCRSNEPRFYVKPFHVVWWLDPIRTKLGGFWHCFACGLHGDVVSFVARICQISVSEALEELIVEAFA